MLWMAAAMATYSVIAVIGLAIDDRMITGAPAWAKPLKFGISIALYGVVWAWLLSYLTGRPRRIASIASIGIAAAFAVEMVAITVQVLRGTSSHFNQQSTFDSTVYSAMAGSVVVLYLLTLGLSILLFRVTIPDRALRHAIRWGVVIGLVGMGLAFLMTSPTAQQLATEDAGGTVDAMGAHTVGAVDGGPGLPLLGWSTEYGDLRIGHFVGMHALQIIPLVALLLAGLAPRRPWLTEHVRITLIIVLAAAWLAATGLVTWQALRGQSIVAPDMLTLQAWGLLAIGMVAGVGLGIRLGGPASSDGTAIATVRRSVAAHPPTAKNYPE